MRECKHKDGTNCKVAEKLSGKPVSTRTEDACRVCSIVAKPRQVNRITETLAGINLESATTDKPQKKTQSARPKGEGAGTELHKILESLGITTKRDCKCLERAWQMNEMGPQWCRENVDTIISWLEHEAKRRKFRWLFRRFAAKLLVLQAIKSAEKQARRDA